MSQTNPIENVSEAFSGKDPAKTAMLIYILYLVGFLLWVTPLIAIVLAYMYRRDMTGWLESHSTFLIRTFWLSLLYCLVATVLTVLLVGFLLYVAIVVWLIVRCVKGLQALSKREPIADPKAWLF